MNVRPSVHNFCRESGNGSRHSNTSPHSWTLVISPVALFIFPNTADDWRAGGWRASREGRNGRVEWRGEGVGERNLLFRSSSCILFSAFMNRLVGQVFFFFPNLCWSDSSVSCWVSWWVKCINYDFLLWGKKNSTEPSQSTLVLKCLASLK